MEPAWRKITRRAAAVLIVGAGLLPAAASADQPLPAPASLTVKSRSGRYIAELDYPALKTTVYSIRSGVRSELWSIERWSRVAFLTDIGPTLALGNEGSNLLPLDANEDTVIVTLVQKGQAVREIRLRDIEPFASLRRTISHLAWGVHLGFDAEGRYRVETIDRRILAFGLEGKPAEMRR